MGGRGWGRGRCGRRAEREEAQAGKDQGLLRDGRGQDENTWGWGWGRSFCRSRGPLLGIWFFFEEQEESQAGVSLPASPLEPAGGSHLDALGLFVLYSGAQQAG